MAIIIFLIAFFAVIAIFLIELQHRGMRNAQKSKDMFKEQLIRKHLGQILEFAAEYSEPVTPQNIPTILEMYCRANGLNEYNKFFKGREAVSKYKNVSIHDIQQAEKRGDLRPVRLGNILYFKREEVQQWLR